MRVEIEERERLYDNDKLSKNELIVSANIKIS